MLTLTLTLLFAQAELPPEARVIPVAEAPAPPSVVTRSLLSIGGAALSSGVGLGISLLLVGQNPRFDPVFATAALSSILVTGVAFTLHEALGGRGEITLSFLAAALVMAGSAGLAIAINPARDVAPFVTTAIGAIPAAAAAVLALEGTSPKAKSQGVRVQIAPTGIAGRF